MKAKTTWQEKRDEVLAVIRQSGAMNDAIRGCAAVLGRPVTLDALRNGYKTFRAQDVNLPTLDALLGCDLSEEKVAEAVASQPTLHPAELEVRKLKRWLSEARHAEAEAIRRVEQADERMRVVLDIVDPPQPKKIKPRGKTGKREATQVSLVSDNHLESRVDAATVNGRNEFNLEIADRRLGQLFEGIAWSLRHHRNGYNIDNLVLWLGGDLITGYIHEELAESNYLSPVQAIMFAQEHYIQGIDYLKTQDVKLTVPCNFGNHGRTTQKRRIQTAAANSFEWLMYQNLKKHYANDDQVEFQVSDGAHLYMDIYDWTMRFHHGDDVKYWGGVGGLSIPLRKAIDSWNEFKHADYTCIGHFHTFQDFKDCVVNGSLIGFDAFALSIKARYERPVQATFLIDKEFGKVQVSPIVCD